MKTYLKQRGLSLASVAEELGTSPQNLNGKLKAKSLKSDFISAIKAIIDRCAPPLPAEMEGAVIVSNVNGSNSPNLRLDTTKKRNLSVEEIRSIFEAGGDELVDMFLLMFLLIGINVSDLFALTKGNIVRGRLEYDRAKTGRHYSVLLHPEALRIIEKYKGEKKLLRFSEHFRNVDVATVMINKKLAKVRPGLTTYYARHTWASIAFNIGIQKDVVSLALGHSFGVRVTDTYINADTTIFSSNILPSVVINDVCHFKRPFFTLVDELH